MKKLVSITSVLAIVFAVSFVSCNGQTSGKANLGSDVDSLSYAAGIFLTNGIDGYFEQTGIGEFKEDFLKGFNEGINIKEDDKKTQAKVLGLQTGHQIATRMLPQMNAEFFGMDSEQSIDLKILQAAVTAVVLDKNPEMTTEEAEKISQEVSERVKAKASEGLKEENAKYLADNKSKEGVVTLPSGLQYKVITQGTGERPLETDIVEVHYHGTKIDGSVFDSSVERGETIKFPLNGVIRGWTEGLQLMPVGSKYIFYIPYDLAYGEQGRPGSIPPYATLIFEVELFNIEKQ